MINKDDYAFWLALCRIKRLGSVGKKKLLDHFSSVEQVFSTDAATLKALGLRDESVSSICHPDWHAVETDMLWLEKPNHHLVTINCAEYPVLLREVGDSPVILFAHGQLDVLQDVQIAIVGSRNPDALGRQVAKEFARGLVYAGASITSGLALGIDGCSHQGALDVGGHTIAVVGNGLDMVYPAKNQPLAEKIVSTGVLLSEFVYGTKPLATHFPMRNRIISGMSVGVLVVQATLHSGSLITARYAMDQGREVFAIPGSIYSPLEKGCHALIKQGAKLVESVNDVIDELDSLVAAAVVPKTMTQNIGAGADEYTLDADCNLLLDNISHNPISIDRLVYLTGLNIGNVASMLLMLELRGLVISQAGAVYVKAA